MKEQLRKAHKGKDFCAVLGTKLSQFLFIKSQWPETYGATCQIFKGIWALKDAGK